MTLQPVGRKVVTVGNYKFTGRRLGKGNFAKVEEASHVVLNVKVAIKIMDVNTIKEDYVIRNLYREAKIMSRLSHPCIAALFQTMQHGNLYYLVTELVGGGDLCNFIKGQRNGKLEEHYTRVFARQLVSAISHMHNLGIVHRDLKMENVMLNLTNDRIKIVDFGLSNIFNGGSPLRTHCGSPEYAAPELFVEGKHYGPEVDLWSLGVILYGMVVGQLPFVSSSRDGATTTPQQRRKKLLEQINRGLASSHRKALALFSPDFKAMMGKLLVADSSKRINITELIFHPWVTEKGRKSIRSNPLKKLDEPAQNNVLKEVAQMLRINLADAQQGLKSDPHGNIAGMYNLIVHRRTVAYLESDSILSNVQNISPRPKSSKITPRIIKPKSPTKRHSVLKSAPLQKTTRTISPTPRRELRTPKPEKNQGDGKQKQRIKPTPILKDCGINFVPLRRPVSSQGKYTKRATSEKFLNVNPKRETIEKKISRPSPFLLNNLIPSPKGDETPKSKSYDLYNDLLYNMSLPIQHTRNHKECCEKLYSPNNVQTRRASRTQSASQTPENAIIKSNQLPVIRRPLTTGPTHTAERAAKRRSMLPVMTKKRSQNKTGTGISTINKGHNVVSANILEDDAKRHICSPGKHCNQRLNDFNNKPIAKSIAGYVCKNISSKLEPLKWIKGNSKGNTEA